MNPKEQLSYKICDPVHGFIRFNEIERKLINSRPFQRLRYIHQMGCAYLVYPGATHKRFEHSIGTMELVSRIYDNITHPRNLDHNLLEGSLPDSQEEYDYWRQVLRFAALCHDVGHLPFSHTAENELLPEGGHELMTCKLIQDLELKKIWEEISFKDRSIESDIITLCISEKELHSLECKIELSPWQRVLSQVITEDNFGADRIDYLLRDSKFTGVGYGHFDFHQLIDTLRILPSLSPDGYDKTIWTLGVAESGVQSIESLWIARYLMYARVYHHPKARIYSMHLNRFMKFFFEDRGFPNTVTRYLKFTDYEILSEISKAADDPSSKGHYDALCLMNREQCFQEVHFYGNSMKESDSILQKLKKEHSQDFFLDFAPSKQRIQDKEKLRCFPVITDEKRIIASLEVSEFLREIPLGGKAFRLYVSPELMHTIMNMKVSHEFRK